MTQSNDLLKRELGLFGASLVGVGSMVGTGVFVSIGLAAAQAGPGVVAAIVLAAALALCNALSSAQLAAAQPVSGGTYEYGYARLTPELGFTAGWMFLCAKTASAATAALGFGGYLLHALGFGAGGLVPLAVAAVAALTALVLAGLRRSNWMNALIVSATLTALIALIVAGAPRVAAAGTEGLMPTGLAGDGLRPLLYATALMFVAFTGYGRIATMGEEVHDPRRIIPRAILVTLAISAVLYIGVALVAVSVLDLAALGAVTEGSAAPLETVARALGQPWLAILVSAGAVTAMLGVLLNLILGLSRMALAMGRRGDLPRVLARVDPRGVPAAAVLAVGAAIAALALIGSIELAWSFSAFTVLVYYAITNLAALRLPAADRLYPRAFPMLGLAGCVFLAFWVPPLIWGTGLGLIAAGLLARALIRRSAWLGN